MSEQEDHRQPSMQQHDPHSPQPPPLPPAQQQGPVPVRSSDRLSSMNNEDASTLTMSTALYQEDMAEEESDVSDEGEEEEAATSSSGSSNVMGEEGRSRPSASTTAALGQQDEAGAGAASTTAVAGAAVASSSASVGERPSSTSFSSSPRAPPSPPPPPPTYGSFLHAVVLGCLVVAMSFGINILNLLVYLLVRPVSRVAARRLVGGVFQAMWVNVAAYLLPRSELVMTGDMPVDPTRPAIIIANHQVHACVRAYVRGVSSRDRIGLIEWCVDTRWRRTETQQTNKPYRTPTQPRRWTRTGGTAGSLRGPWACTGGSRSF
jgi:hypothetical protein